MGLENRRVILVYGFEEGDLQPLNKIIRAYKLPELKIIEKSMIKMTIQNILEDLKLDVYDGDIPRDRVILFNNLSDKELETAINKIRNNIKPSPILAVVTETSITWTFEELLKHLIEEREWFKDNEKN